MGNRFSRVAGAVAAALALVALLAQSVLAVDFSSQLTAASAPAVADLAPVLLVAAGIGIGVIFAFKGLKWLFQAGRKAG